MIVPVPGPGTEAIGVLVVGRRLDGRLVRSVDLPFLEAAGHTCHAAPSARGLFVERIPARGDA